MTNTTETNTVVKEGQLAYGTVINADFALGALHKVARGKRDYVYKDEFRLCQNFGEDDVTPQCIVGHVFAAWGFTFAECGNLNVSDAVDKLLMKRPDMVITVGAVIALTAAQAVQDNGGTWGLGIETAVITGRAASTGHVGENLWPRA